jgi:hypothetical protein
MEQPSIRQYKFNLDTGRIGLAPNQPGNKRIKKRPVTPLEIAEDREKLRQWKRECLGWSAGA